MEPESIRLRSRWRLARRKASKLHSLRTPRSSNHGESRQGDVGTVGSNLHAIVSPTHDPSKDAPLL